MPRFKGVARGRGQGGSGGGTAIVLSAASFVAGAAAGTLVGNITNVPAGQTPTVSPNDGRVVIAGDGTNGWKLNVGATVSSARNFAFTISAAGATSLSGTMTVAVNGSDPYPNRYNAQLGWQNDSGFNNGRLYTNLIRAVKFANYTAGSQAGLDGLGPYLTTSSYVADPNVFNADKGSFKRMPPGAMQVQVKAQRPWPKPSSETGRWLAFYSNRPEVRMSATGVSPVSGPYTATAGSPILGRTTGVFYFAFYTWDTSANLGAYQYNVGPYGSHDYTISGIPNATSDGGAETELWLCEIQNNSTGNGNDSGVAPNSTAAGWSWVQDPVTDPIWYPTLDDRSFFGVMRYLDQNHTNESSMFIPRTAANQPMLGSGSGTLDFNTVETPAMTVSVTGGSLTIGIGGGPQANVAAGDLFDSTKTLNAPWRPIGASANAMSIVGAAPSSAYARTNFAWNGLTQTLTITPAIISGTTETWATVSSNFQTWLHSDGSVYPFSAGMSTINYITPNGVGSSAATAFSRQYFTGGRTSQRPGDISKEALVIIHNRNRTDLWWNIPAGADESYIRSWAGYFADNLWPGCKVYVANSNESFNTGFIRFYEISAYAAYLSGGASNDRYVGEMKNFTDNMTIVKNEVAKRGINSRCSVIVTAECNRDDEYYGSLTSNKNNATYGAAWLAILDALAPNTYYTGTLANTYSPPTWQSGSAYTDGQFIKYQPSGASAANLYMVNGARTAATGSEPGTSGQMGNGLAGTSRAAYILLVNGTTMTTAAGATTAYKQIEISATGLNYNAAVNISATLARLQYIKTFASANGKKMLSYEGGSHDNPGGSDPLVTVFHADWFRSTDAGDVQAHHLYQLFQLAGADTVIPQFGDSDTPNLAHPWSFQDYPGAPDTRARRRVPWKAFVAGTLADVTS